MASTDLGDPANAKLFASSELALDKGHSLKAIPGFVRIGDKGAGVFWGEGGVADI